VERFPVIEPFDHGLLEVGDGHHVYWEACGNPGGRPALFLHGGPGAGCTAAGRRYFDPEVYCVVLFDQRGSGRSHPRVDAMTDLSTNTTHHLVADIEQLRQHLGVERWVVAGASWGVTLALVYAEQYPQHVGAMILSSVTMTRPHDIHWLYHETGRFFPEEWERFRAGVPEADRDGDLVAAYHRLLHEHPDRAVRQEAAKAWCAWEDAVQSLEEDWVPNPRYADPAFRMTFARVVTHYFHHRAWLADGQLLRDADRLAGIPGVLVHGRLDLGSPPDVPWLLARAWPDVELLLVRTGHGGGEEMSTCRIEASNRFSSMASFEPR
jgi:proline iminopeptidase